MWLIDYSDACPNTQIVLPSLRIEIDQPLPRTSCKLEPPKPTLKHGEGASVVLPMLTLYHFKVQPTLIYLFSSVLRQ